MVLINPSDEIVLINLTQRLPKSNGYQILDGALNQHSDNLFGDLALVAFQFENRVAGRVGGVFELGTKLHAAFGYEEVIH